MRACSSLVGTIRKCKYLAFTVCPPQWQQSHQHSVLKKKVQYLFWLPGPSSTRAPCTAGFRMEPRFALLAFWLPTAHVLQVNNPLASTPSDWHSRKKSTVWVQGAYLIQVEYPQETAVRIDALDKVCEDSLWTCKYYRIERCYCLLLFAPCLGSLEIILFSLPFAQRASRGTSQTPNTQQLGLVCFLSPCSSGLCSWVTWYLWI